MSKKYKINKNDIVSIVKVFAWSFASAFIAGLIAVVNSGQLPPEYLAYVPLINSFLYGVKKWLEDYE
ncbi:hypothetical protein D6827_01385, partial [Candidatus Parcubacteria bacterium]